MQTIAFQCCRCGSEIYPRNAQEEYGDIFIPCARCKAKNVVNPFVYNKTIISGLWQISGWRE